MTTPPRSKREIHTVLLDFILIFGDLFSGDALLEDDDEGYRTTGLISVVCLSL